MNILIVDDEKLIVKGLTHSLEQQGYNTLAAYDGAQAISILAREEVDCIILDLMLPEIDGLILCKNIREKHSIPILMLTARMGIMKLRLNLAMTYDKT